mmetsp:Transcript_10607/g.24694  ORF Transcript_10607/g.24694 Transcript_10607/m.24694 type:complete len:608 (-) Transcript_10607:264-2087(-)
MIFDGRGGVQRYLYDASGPGYQIVPTSMDGDSSAETCFLTGNGTAPVSLFPDMTYFPTTPDEGPCEVRGLACEAYTLRSPGPNATTGFDGNYTLFVDPATGLPLRFHFVGFNVILGSHLDEYMFDYLKVVPSLLAEDWAESDPSKAAPNCFAPPQGMQCAALDDDDGAGGGAQDRNRKKKGPFATKPKPDPRSPLADLHSLLPQPGLQPWKRWGDAQSPKKGENQPGSPKGPQTAGLRGWQGVNPASSGSATFGPNSQNQGKVEGWLGAAEAELAERFGRWATRHGKKYATPDEWRDRAKIFRGTELYVRSMNRRPDLRYWLAANHLADRTLQERDRMRGRLLTPEGTRVPATKVHTVGKQATPAKKGLFGKGANATDDDDQDSAGAQPDQVDWVAAGAVTSVKDQGSCGSCWSFGATGTTEGALFRETGMLVPLSEQILMDCSWNHGNMACDGGLDYQGFAWMLEHGGALATESTYPYLNADGYCRASSSDPGAVRIEGFASVEGGVPALNDALANVGPISVSIDASPPSFYFYAGGLYDDPACRSGLSQLDHTVLAVGYVTEEDGSRYTVLKNSWSAHWGDAGFAYVGQAHNTCGAATQPTYTYL